jgi:hypothetical protein
VRVGNTHLEMRQHKIRTREGDGVAAGLLHDRQRIAHGSFGGRPWPRGAADAHDEWPIFGCTLRFHLFSLDFWSGGIISARDMFYFLADAAAPLCGKSMQTRGLDRSSLRRQN